MTNKTKIKPIITIKKSNKFNKILEKTIQKKLIHNKVVKPRLIVVQEELVPGSPDSKRLLIPILINSLIYPLILIYQKMMISKKRKLFMTK
jgi:hypothetical protein